MTTSREVTIADLLHGIPLGERRSSQTPIKSALANLGLPTVDRSTISDIRNGGIRGSLLVRGVEIHERLQKSDGSFKIDFYQLIARLGTKAREHQEIRTYRWSSVGFNKRLSENIGLELSCLTRIINAMRLDIVYHAICDPNSLPDNLLQTFDECTEEYFSDYDPTDDGYRNTVYETKNYWDGTSIPSFYEALGKRNSPRITGTWGPYEMDLLFKYYSGLKSQKSPLTPLDRFILEEKSKGTLAREISSWLKSKTSIEVSRTTLVLHTNALIGRYDELTKELNSRS